MKPDFAELRGAVEVCGPHVCGEPHTPEHVRDWRPPMIEENPRAVHRTAVRFDAEWEGELRAGDVSVAGKVLDVSLEGAFIATPVLPDLEHDEPVELVLLSETGLTLRATASVKWMGHSATHNCSGIGVRLAHAPDQIAEWYHARTRRWFIRNAFETAWPQASQAESSVVV